MTLLPDFYHVENITSRSNNIHIAEVHLNPGHPIFGGHFPNNPVAPGVCMMQILKELVEEVEQKPLFLAHASNVKFTALINPNENPVLHFEFEISHDEQGQVKVKNTTTFEETVALKLTVLYNMAIF
ncbi:hotdog family protein [Sphingobacterium chuzhouense]|uniref:3-hydroxyacyl-ACP dehydratase n=1 Tax=Sphingobacterium chuzhouense TaxID=1742264 RepID=A0ABR7XQM1_9SPHI|nr:3-hydroxyacyl-ACP dehydratase [Sphingobacterium chuzhouense]MBD1420829.1 3-hydroxyacyl-ACP dehydratase [Sphingobacterium chuzhouense]